MHNTDKLITQTAFIYEKMVQIPVSAQNEYVAKCGLYLAKNKY